MEIGITILAFAFTTIFVVFGTKDKMNAIASVVICYFLTLLFLNLTIANYDNLRESILSLTIYFSCIFAVCLGNFSLRKSEVNLRKLPLLLTSAAFLTALMFATFTIARNVEKVHQTFEQNKFEQQKELMFGSNNFQPKNSLEIINENNKFFKSAQIKTYADSSRMSYFKERLSKNFLLKNFFIAILIIGAALVISAITTKKEGHDL